MKYCNRQKKSTSTFWWFSILYHSHILKKCFRKQSVYACVCVWVCFVCPSPNVEPKPINRSRSKSIPSFFSQIFRAVFSVLPLPLKLRVVHIRKKYKILIFSKMAPTILTKFCGFIVHSKPNNMTLSAFPGKIVTRIILFNFLCVS